LGHCLYFLFKNYGPDLSDSVYQFTTLFLATSAPIINFKFHWLLSGINENGFKIQIWAHLSKTNIFTGHICPGMKNSLKL
jgi:hypothetical protein